MLPALNTIHHGEALQVMRTWASGFIDMCVTSPPYWGLRNYGVRGQLGLERTPQEYVARLVEILAEVRRVLRDDGTLWLNLGDSYTSGRQGRYDSLHDRVIDGKRMTKKQGWATAAHRPRPGGGLKSKDIVGVPWMAAFALREAGWYLRSDIIWAKPNAIPESVRDRPTRSHEYLFLLSKQETYFYDHEAAMEPCVSSPSDIRKMSEARPRLGGKTISHQDKLNNASARTKVGTKRSVGSPRGRNRRSVWTVSPSQFGGKHFATFPPALIEPCILAGSRRGGGGGPYWIRSWEQGRQPSWRETLVGSSLASSSTRTTSAWLSGAWSRGERAALPDIVRPMGRGERWRLNRPRSLPSSLLLQTISGRSQPEAIRRPWREDGPSITVRPRLVRLAQVQIRRWPAGHQLRDLPQRRCRLGFPTDSRSGGAGLEAMARAETLHVRKSEEGQRNQPRVVLHRRWLEEVRDN